MRVLLPAVLALAVMVGIALADTAPQQTVKPSGQSAKFANAAQGVDGGFPLTITCPDGTCSGGGGTASSVAVNDGTTSTQKLAVDASGKIGINNFPASQAVTGTFFQATQPVSGTFFQATQPVSGTFFQSTQPVSGTVAATQSGSWTNACTQSGTWTVQPGNTANSTAWLVDASDRSARLLGVLSAGSNVIGKVSIDQTTPGTTNLVQDAADGTIGSAVPAKVGAVAQGRDSTGLQQAVICDKSAFVNPTTATTTQIVALSGSTVVYVCAYEVNFVGSATANTAIFKYGTGTACGTGTTVLSGTMFGPTATGSGTQVNMGSGVGYMMKTAAANALCITTSAATTVGATVSYAQF